MAKRSKNKFKKIVLISGIIILALMGVCAVYLGDYYHADMEKIEQFTYGNEVEIQSDEKGNLIFEPEAAKNGFIFYPGGKVEYTSYIPLMQVLASKGLLCVLVEMPFNLAVFDVDAAEEITEEYSQIEKWYIGGHSLGGSMAAACLADNIEDFEGLVLLGSYSVDDLSELDLDVISIYGSDDRVMNKEKYEDNKALLPVNFTEVVIDGGCHAYFGMYGEQEGDGTASITSEEQIYYTAEAISDVMK